MSLRMFKSESKHVSGLIINKVLLIILVCTRIIMFDFYCSVISYHFLIVENCRKFVFNNFFRIFYQLFRTAFSHFYQYEKIRY